MTVHVSGHAIERYLERVDHRLTWDEVRDILSSPIIVSAARFGAPYVILGTGQRVVLDRGVVVTVLPKGHKRGRLDPWRTQDRAA